MLRDIKDCMVPLKLECGFVGRELFPYILYYVCVCA